MLWLVQNLNFIPTKKFIFNPKFKKIIFLNLIYDFKNFLLNLNVSSMIQFELFFLDKK